MALRTAQLLALLLTAIALVPAGAHLAEMPAKLTLEVEDYFTVQSIYRGWFQFGIVLFAALAADIWLAFLLRGQRMAMGFALGGALTMAVVLAIFFIWTFPTNQATESWTVIPESWEALRRQWEYAHATAAIVTFLSLVCVTLSTVTSAAQLRITPRP